MAQGKGNPEINKKVATSALVTTILSGVGFYLGNRYWEAVASFGGQFFEHWGDGFALMWPLIAENPVHIDMSPNAMLAGLTMCVLVWLFWLRYVAFVGNFRAGEESGSARWGTLKEGKQFRDLTTEDNNLIFTQNFGLALHRPKFNPELDRNLNVLVVGGSGSGKTFNYVTPNICQLNTSYFITDPKGTLLKDAGFLFTDNGYKVKSFNTINLDESMHYNPLKYVKTDTDILSFVNCYIMNTNGDGKAGDPFWENSEKMLYTSLIALLRDWFPPEDYNLSSLLTLLSMAEARENDENFKSPLDLLFLQIEEGKRYIPNEGGAPAPSMGISGLSRNFGTGNATGDSDWSWEPTNLKRNSDGVRPADYGGKLPTPVHFIFDEFANIGTIPQIEETIAVTRSRNIGITIILQSMSQLESKYDKKAQTIVDCCDSTLFLGGKSNSTNKEIAEMIGKQTINQMTYGESTGQSGSASKNLQIQGRDLIDAAEIGKMSRRKAILLIAGTNPLMDDKFDPHTHKRYCYIVDKRNPKRLHDKPFDFKRYLEGGCEPYDDHDDGGTGGTH